MKNWLDKKINLWVVMISTLFYMMSCTQRSVNDSEEAHGIDLFDRYRDSTLPVYITSLSPAWKGNSLIAANAKINAMKIIFELDLSKVTTSLGQLSTKDNFTNSDIYVEMLVNGQSFSKELSEIKTNRKSGSMYADLNDSTGIFLLKFSATQNYPLKITVPLFALRRLAANKKLDIKMHVWQDYFLCDKQHEPNKDNPHYYPDTLHMKLIDNTYNFSFKMPDVLKSEIICDSIILQNDDKWSPAGSDHTLFKSSYPDIFYALEDYNSFEQNTSHVEKSTDTFNKGDTLVLYRYKKHEPFYLDVYDYDFLSKNDILGDTLLDIDKIPQGKNIQLKFGHVSRFYFKLKNYGKIN